MSMNPVTATPVEREEILADLAAPGAFSISESGTWILCVCPCGCKRAMNLPIREGEKQEGAWHWDGIRSRPTLSPSIRAADSCRFHGHLRAGVWTFEPDSGVQP